jgi:hypothetical protein
VKQNIEKGSPLSSRPDRHPVKPACVHTRKPPRRLFRQPRERVPRVRDIWAMDPGDDRRFLSMMRTIGPRAHREIDRLSEEAGTILLLLFFARYRGWERVQAGGTIIDLTGELTGSHRFVPENLPAALREAWEGIRP